MSGEDTQKRKQILVVEDHPESLELLQLILEGEGYRVHSAETGRGAIQAIASPPGNGAIELHPDLIILDLRLPDMHGTEVVKELQENLPEVPPVVFLSADPPQSLREAAESVGAEAVRKPFDFDELLQAINRALAKIARARVAIV
jgi:CheY-like chemotaxis protein